MHLELISERNILKKDFQAQMKTKFNLPKYTSKDNNISYFTEETLTKFINKGFKAQHSILYEKEEV